jgi:ubiquinone/menaquinone biosynthesis C-methylase UbiE
VALSGTERAQQNAHRRRAWNDLAPRYDRQMGWWERRLFGTGNRRWVGRRARGRVLDVAVGTGLNLPYYPDRTTVAGVDLSRRMLDVARRRAAELRRPGRLVEGDAHRLPVADRSVDTVVCTFSLCNVPDVHQALTEMRRVLRPGGQLVLVDHVRSTVLPIRWLQKGVEVISVRVDGDHMTRRPAEALAEHGFEIVERERFRAGIVERLVAVAAGT